MRMLTTFALTAFTAAFAAAPLAADGHQNCPMHGKKGQAAMQAGGHQHGTTAAAGKKGGGGMQGRGMGQGKRRGMGMRGDNPSHHENIHALMGDHEQVTRKVEQLANGVRTDTTSEDPKVAETIRVHVREMKDRLEKGQPIRMFDPLFREIFAHHDKIEMKIEDIPGGARVTETSSDANVALLIKKHAEAVDGFVAEGMAKMHEPTPLPEGYRK